MVNIIINAVFGDGCISKTISEKTLLAFTSTNRSIIEFKANLIGSKIRPFTQSKKAWGTKPMYEARKVVPYAGAINKLSLISQITLDDFYLWYLDDGSYHQTKNFINLNSHALTRAENMELQFHLWHTFHIESKLACDRKKDGRIFFYLRINKEYALSLLPGIKLFMQKHNITGFEYKIGEASTTSEKAVA